MFEQQYCCAIIFIYKSCLKSIQIYKLMKTYTFPNMKKITLTGLLTLLVLLFASTESYSQTIVLDGDQCLDEYGTPDTPDGDDGYSAPSEISNFWGSYQIDNDEISKTFSQKNQ